MHATAGNLNNLIGVPLTLLALPDAADVAVIEMGMNVPGEMTRLRAIVEPDDHRDHVRSPRSISRDWAASRA